MEYSANNANHLGNILLVEQDLYRAGETRSSLGQAGYKVEVVSSHLKGLSRLDDFPFDIGLIAAEPTDIQGVEFCRLVRNREKEFNLAYTYLILFSPERLRTQITEKCEQADDFIIEPYLYSELLWRLKKGLAMLETQRNLSKMVQIEPDTGVLNKKGLDLYFQEEVNRLSRKQEWVSLVILQINGLERMTVDYGTVWVNWVREQIAFLLRKSLRNYDRLGKLDKGLFCLFAPETPVSGVQSIISRLESDISQWSVKQGSSLPYELSLNVKALCLQAKLDYRGQRRAVQSIWRWIDILVQEKAGEKIYVGFLKNNGIDLLEK